MRLDALKQSEVAVDHRHHTLAVRQVGLDQRGVAREAEPGDLAIAMARELNDVWVVGIEYRHAFGQDDIHLRAIHLHAFGVTVNFVGGQVFCPVDLGDDANLAAFVGQAFAEQLVCTIFNNCGLHFTVHENAPRIFKIGAITAMQEALVYKEPGTAR